MLCVHWVQSTSTDRNFWYTLISAKYSKLDYVLMIRHLKSEIFLKACESIYTSELFVLLNLDQR